MKCGKCKIKNVRLYRPYGMFYREKDNTCNNCLPEDRLGWVPCVPAEDGSIWGYSSASEEDCLKWYKLPESNPRQPIWDSYRSRWSNSKL